MKEYITKARDLVKLADEFEKAAELQGEEFFARMDRDYENNVYMIAPWVTTQVFAVELFMKAIYLLENKVPHRNTHDLKVIFESLSEDVKIEITEFIDSENFETELVDISNAFVSWRYCENIKNIRAEFSDRLLWSVGGCALRLLKQRSNSAYKYIADIHLPRPE